MDDHIAESASIMATGGGHGQDAAIVAPVLPDVAAQALFAALDAEAEEEAMGGP